DLPGLHGADCLRTDTDRDEGHVAVRVETGFSEQRLRDEDRRCRQALYSDPLTLEILHRLDSAALGDADAVDHALLKAEHVLDGQPLGHAEDRGLRPGDADVALAGRQKTRDLGRASGWLDRDVKPLLFEIPKRFS